MDSLDGITCRCGRFAPYKPCQSDANGNKGRPIAICQGPNSKGFQVHWIPLCPVLVISASHYCTSTFISSAITGFQVYCILPCHLISNTLPSPGYSIWTGWIPYFPQTYLSPHQFYRRI
ncbi:uncharacterized protein LACBIDRAFT_327689 [Laccaria bicolor S238N-H82]|uniref:Predicted protein n=1 Tax=Laccaria bicolor (strain S238N-H82 / ATCC MYA-4686) TaxID=486041 RepID=B0DCJ0_LACBS|nr:uncharacterized protein LACBIDRAFT_327689 [Laccaria bicolor S238N-H82]EDR07908.1 predicted protein [Laccaria bicolor S238N-H82]|eukprot:XP_001881697.1 predicted protein [Laccaria bicolor S238N-H82]